jgi:transposase/Zn finger protein HypA/HybF involved in hydrogenase expression
MKYKISDNVDRFKKSIKTSETWTEAAVKMGYDTNNPYKYFQRKCREYNINYDHLLKTNNNRFSKKALKNLITKEKIEKSNSVRDLIKNIGFDKDVDKNGTLHRNVKKILEDGDFDVSHFTGPAWNKGKTKLNDLRIKKQSEKISFDFEKIFCKNSTYCGSGCSLIRKLLENHILKYECSKCKNIGNWDGEFLRLQIDHINGVNDDNRVENLRLLCPNCHSQTETYCCSDTKKRTNKEKDKLISLIEYLN